MDTVDIIASGYEWRCPKCNTLNKELDCTSIVECSTCWIEFETNPPDHAY